jgi:predicted RNase H-like nuclease
VWHAPPAGATGAASVPTVRAASGRVVGIDAAGRHGWVGVLVDDGGVVGARTGALAEIVAWAEPVDVVGVDIPIGDVPGGVRRAEAAARAFVGPRAASILSPPPLDVLAVPYAEANAALAARGAPRLSRQAWALGPKMLEAAALAAGDDRVHEVHPEVSFRELAGAPLPWSKKSWNGLMLRRRLLAGAGLALPDELPGADGVPADDVVDATAVAWSARRIAAGTARTFPDPPEEAGGRLVAIWC